MPPSRFTKKKKDQRPDDQYLLSHIVEFRNGESGRMLHIRTITEVLLNRLVQKTDRYSLTQEG